MSEPGAGDIVAILDDTGAKVVNYTYDAWGTPVSTSGTMAGTWGVLQPFRYRGYVYDEETGLYYLRSRYYLPERCRFVSADALLKGNLYYYCEGNPVDKSDPSGRISTDDTTHPIAGEDGDGLQHTLRNNTRNRMSIPLFMDCLAQMVAEEWLYLPKSDGGITYGHTDCVGVFRHPIFCYYSEEAYKKLTNIEGYSNAVIEAVMCGDENNPNIIGYVKIRELEESERLGGVFTHCGYLKTIDYSTWGY